MAVFTNMFIASKSLLYPPCIDPPRTLTFLFTDVSLIRSPCFVENLSPVRLRPNHFPKDISRLMCLIYDELPIMHVDMSGNDCYLDGQIQKVVAAKVFLLLNASQCYIP